MNSICGNGNTYGTDRSALRSVRSGKKIFRIFVLLLLVISVLVIVFSSKNSIRADEHDTSIKQYTSIKIESGDTLWSIASEYMDSHYGSRQEYIDEVKYINNLSSDTIIADEYLMIPYYKG